MASLQDLMLFVVASLVFLVIPGPSVMYVVARSVAHGRRAGLVSVAGIHAGTLIHIAAAVFGLAAILAASATLFAIVKAAGAAYLLFLGVRALTSRRDAEREVVGRPVGERRLFWDGFVVNLLNPKSAVFFLAFLPQFVDRQAALPVWAQSLALGMILLCMGLVSDSLYALAASAAGAWLRGRTALVARFRALEGWTLIGLGALSAAGVRRS